MRVFAAIAVLSMLLAGCASVISKGVRETVDRAVTIEMVQADPESYLGRKVIWGGTIISSKNLETVTDIEVLETRLAYDDTPAGGDSRGRFIIEAERFLDTAVYKKEKRVTVAGVIKGIRVQKIGKMDYHYPVLEPIEIKLVAPPSETPYFPYFYDELYPSYGWYGPYYPYYPRPYYPYRQYPYRHYPYPYPYPY